MDALNVSTAGEPAPGQHLMSEAIRAHQSSSELIRGHQRPSEAIRFGAWPAPIADDHVVAHGGVGVTDAPDEGGHQRSSELIRGHQRS